MAAIAISQRNSGLDYLRTLSISIVLANHCLIAFFFETGRVELRGFVAHLSASAVISIEWLFVLSGYLIGTMMIRSFEKPGTWFERTREFWLRRWFRTVPNYYLFLLVNAWLVYAGVATGSFHWTFLVFSQNLYLPEPQPHFFGESWSLATDEWFYFLMPLVLGVALLFRRIGVEAAFMLTAAVLIVVPAVARGVCAIADSLVARGNVAVRHSRSRCRPARRLRGRSRHPPIPAAQTPRHGGAPRSLSFVGSASVPRVSRWPRPCS